LRLKSFGDSAFECSLTNFKKNTRGQYVVPLQSESLKIDLN